MSIPFSRFKVYGNSMFPTLKPGQDVVIIKKNDTEIVKRIGQITSDPPAGRAGRNIFVQGDNKKESTDSISFGPISSKEIVGKVVYVR